MNKKVFQKLTSRILNLQNVLFFSVMVWLNIKEKFDWLFLSPVDFSPTLAVLELPARTSSVGLGGGEGDEQGTSPRHQNSPLGGFAIAGAALSCPAIGVRKCSSTPSTVWCEWNSVSHWRVFITVGYSNSSGGSINYLQCAENMGR